jgi:hypothetical protein
MHNTAPKIDQRFHFDKRLNFRISKTVKTEPPARAAAANAHTTASSLLSDRASPINSVVFRAPPIETR